MHLQPEIDKFNNLAHEWWNLDGQFKTLHHINPARIKFIQHYTLLTNKQLIDIGCGGGILAESMAREGAIVSAIDLAPQLIEMAQLHLYESNLHVNYECIDIRLKATQQPEFYDVLTCMEMLEHVPNPNLIIAECSKLLKPNGLAFFSTLNRNFKSYALGIITAEYLLKLVPKGTHAYTRFIKPAELRKILATNGFEIIALQGIDYNPLTQYAGLGTNTDINYLMACRKTC